jgi:Tfp pilus assembly protein FimT
MSLTESCIAAAIVSTVMAISVPALLRAGETYSLQSAARDTASRMHSARISAIARNRDCRLNVVSGISYVLECQEPAWRVIEQVTLPRGITVSANNRPEFHRRGNVSPTATFTLRNRSGNVLKVVVNVNGRVRIQ